MIKCKRCGSELVEGRKMNKTEIGALKMLGCNQTKALYCKKCKEERGVLK